MKVGLLRCRGKPSVTLTVVAPGFLIVMAKYALAGLTVLGQTFPAMDGSDFATAFGALAAFWWGREHTEKRNGVE